MKILFVFFISCLFIFGCGGIERVDPNVADEDEVNLRFDAKDINSIVAKMVSSLMSHRLGKSNPPKIVLVMNVKNKTYEHIDTKAVTETILTKLLNSGRYRAIAERERTDQLIQDKEYANAMKGEEGISEEDGEIIDPEDERGNTPGIAAPDLVMFGEITSIEKQDSNTTDVFYKITLKLVDSGSQMIEWQEQKDIRKREEGGWF